MRFLTIFAMSTFLFFMPVAQAQELVPDTNFVITVKARDAKFVGTAMGGALVTIRDRRTGDILIHGNTSGGTGDTKKIMSDKPARDAILVDDDTAKLQFSLEIFEPIPVTISATGPVGQAQASITVSEDMILIPGKDYTQGNGIMLELPGFAVDVLNPPINAKIKLDPKKPVPLHVNIVKMCGCHIAPNTPWPPERYEVDAHIYVDDIYIKSFPMEYKGQASQFIKNIQIPDTGTYRLIVTAFDKVTKEAGMDATSFTLTE